MSVLCTFDKVPWAEILFALRLHQMPSLSMSSSLALSERVCACVQGVLWDAGRCRVRRQSGGLVQKHVPHPSSQMHSAQVHI